MVVNEWNPGPGHYEPKTSFLNTGVNSLKKSIRPVKTDNHPAHANNRAISIPSKTILGYDWNQKGETVVIDELNREDKKTRYNDNPGPGQYDLELKWVVDNRKSPIKDKDKESNKKKLWLTDLERMNNSICRTRTDDFKVTDKSKTSTIDFTTSIIQKKRPRWTETKTVIFGQTVDLRRLNHQLLLEKQNDPNFKLLSDTKYWDTPGPGFYDKDINDDSLGKSLSIHVKNTKLKQNFGSNLPKVLVPKQATENLGPGTYFQTNNKFYDLNKERTKNKNILPRYETFTQGKNQEVSELLNRIRKKWINKPIGPGEYNISKSWIKKAISNVSDFGTIEERFKNKKEENDLGPTSYSPQNSPDSNEMKNKKYLSKKKIINSLDQKLIEEEAKARQNMFTNKSRSPPVGAYNPGYSTSIEYNIQSKIKPYQEARVGFNSNNKRFNGGMINANSLGPGIYNIKDSYASTMKSYRPFLDGDDRFKERKVSDIPGPGKYDQSSSSLWQKKSFNVLFN